MLFELGGKRKRFIQVIYVFLALLLGGGLVLFGIGGDANGGIADIFGFGSNDSVEGDPATDEQISRLQEDLAADPENSAALAKLARAQFNAAQFQLIPDEEGNVALTDEAISSFEASIDSWERYLDTDPKPIDDDVAGLMIQAYGNVAGTSTSAATTEDQIHGAFEAAQIVAEARPSSGTLVTLGTYAYLAGEDKVAEQARKDALADASDSTAKQQINQQLDSAKAQAKLVEKQLAESAPDKDQLENPLEGLGGTSSAPALPGSTPVPAP